MQRLEFDLQQCDQDRSRTGLDKISNIEISDQVYSISEFSTRKLIRFIFSVFIL